MKASDSTPVGATLNAVALSHDANCRCAPCRAFWWELFVVSDECSVMTGEPEVVR